MIANIMNGISSDEKIRSSLPQISMDIFLKVLSYNEEQSLANILRSGNSLMRKGI